MHLTVVLVAVLAGVGLLLVSCQSDSPAQSKSDTDNSNDDAEDDLPAGAAAIIGRLKPGFSCVKRGYGYYADTANDCKVFHVCWPITNEQGVTINKQWTFICGNETLFNQEKLICDRPDNVDCSQAEKFYSVNNEFGGTTPEK